ncbi:hypothetical protein PanWU01x14_077950 [Parasponia andersonii]|uniref:Uncharacterized protein n=1 Tax=Parasponia andersonii TaxID=3476 RepID=A0A2P5DBU7_PARAD|nr:hypothetical protein PanWU01x14_077950 [Parasponia andersonii]
MHTTCRSNGIVGSLVDWVAHDKLKATQGCRHIHLDTYDASFHGIGNHYLIIGWHMTNSWQPTSGLQASNMARLVGQASHVLLRVIPGSHPRVPGGQNSCQGMG